MDCIISAQSARSFCGAIGCLSKIGKDLYVEFDTEDGLVFRTLNDAKSAFASFHWRPRFFERCTARPEAERERSQDYIYSCRVPLRALAAIVKPRKGVVSLRVKSEVCSDHSYLSFEFQLQKENDLLRVVHRIGVAEADGVSAVAPKDGCSEIVTVPKLLLRMLEPLKRTSEVALIVNDRHKMVTMASFHHCDSVAASTNNALLQASSSTLLKTETTIGVDDFEEFDFRDDRPLGRDLMDDDAEDVEGEEDDVPPENAGEEVTLVFGIKEPKVRQSVLKSYNERG